MRFLASNLQALFALSLVLGTQALPRQTPVAGPRKSGFQPLRRSIKEDGYKAKSNCDAWHNGDDSKRLWHDSQAGVIGDDFINENGVERWVQELDKDIFNEPSSSWNCYDPDTRCELNRKCPGYADKKMEGAYYLALSVQNVVTVLRTARTYLVEETVNRILDIPQIIENFEKPESDAKPNVLVLVAATFGMLAGATAPVAPISGTAGFASGMFALAGNINPPEAPEAEDFEARLSSTVQTAFNKFKDRLDDINGAIVGEKGKDQSLIPSEMTLQSFDNPVINALAGGQWLNDDPARGVEETMESAFHKIKQALAWMMIRHGREGYWFVDSGIDKEKCGDGKDGDHPGEFWHDKADGCIKLMEVKERKDGETVDLAYIPQKIHDKLWGNDGKYDLDAKKTFQNSYDCWVDNDGKVGDVGLDSILDSELPKCWFGIPLVRGRKSERWTSDVDYIMLDKFPGQDKGDIQQWYGKFKDGGLVVE